MCSYTLFIACATFNFKQPDVSFTQSGVPRGHLCNYSLEDIWAPLWISLVPLLCTRYNEFSFLDDHFITHPFSFDSCTLLSSRPPRPSKPPIPLWNNIRSSLSVISQPFAIGSQLNPHCFLRIEYRRRACWLLLHSCD